MNNKQTNVHYVQRGVIIDKSGHFPKLVTLNERDRDGNYRSFVTVNPVTTTRVHSVELILSTGIQNILVKD